MFVAPLLIVNLLVITGPGAASIVFSFTDWDGLSTPAFVGLANYAEMLSSGAVLNAFVHNILWTIFFLIVPMAMGLVGAFLLSRIRRGQILFRVLFFIPYVLATVLSAAIWRQILDPEAGIGAALAGLGIPFLADVNFLGNPSLALGSVAFINTWQWWGFLLVIFLASMQAVDPALYEAARLDGAGPAREFWNITLPSIRPTFVFLGLMTVVWSFLVFDYIYVLTQGGPAGSTDVLSTVMYREAFQNQRHGYASSIAMLLTAISAATVLGYLLLRRKLKWDV
ncbi:MULTISPECIES: carbohydrate ABC transporter permease [Microbacterium]|uniref:Sugar ABC transporter permease n=1 Tax=Microbacterium wangchenii TaxID=2541726 RepID=A0ABX5SW14_9MICO|nr:MULTISPECIES: sugar ABC transporter permease [Microbacterium]MCK6066117.1 sugar ABC transporter permease [Microbacterium sp. EYE_512]QBR90398.1 sugar ABC transporter permease [Microbacterium wangchenii]TFV84795.1 sugar ABC transporter permease [Microbacterium sp. dk485]TXK11586.1 sugar ABC transporter permease [Microbacterium wangchenii]